MMASDTGTANHRPTVVAIDAGNRAQRERLVWKPSLPTSYFAAAAGSLIRNDTAP